MPKREEGEYILELGNRQLLSMVFIIMVLFGIVFSMGYFMGRNSAPEAAAAEVPARPPVAEPAPPLAQRAEAPSPVGTPVPPPGQPLEPSQAKVAAAPADIPAAPLKPAVGESKPAPSSAAAAQVKPAPQPPPSDEPLVPQPPVGQTFLQVAAVKRPEAELIVDVLRRKGFAATVAPGPSDMVFRVLVGPLKDTAAVAKAKADLEAVGFKSSYPRKY